MRAFFWTEEIVFLTLPQRSPKPLVFRWKVAQHRNFYLAAAVLSGKNTNILSFTPRGVQLGIIKPDSVTNYILTLK